MIKQRPYRRYTQSGLERRLIFWFIFAEIALATILAYKVWR